MKTHLKFEPDGTSVYIVFPIKKSSRMFFSKDEVLKAIIKCCRDGDIEPNEAYNFFDEVLDAKNLIWESKYSQNIKFMPNGANGYIEVEGVKTSIITDANAGKELLNIFFKYNVISEEKTQEIFQEIYNFFRFTQKFGK